MREATVFEMFVTIYILGAGVWVFGCLFNVFLSIRPDQSKEEIEQQDKSFYKAPFWPLYLVLAIVKYIIKSCDILIEDIKKLV